MRKKTMYDAPESADIIDKRYVSIEKVKDYLYEIYYDSIDYKGAYKHYLSGGDIANVGACSSVRNGQFYGRNLDWLYNEQAEFIVHTKRLAGKYATVGVAGGMSELTDSFVSSGKFSEAYKILPFQLYDGINECSVIANMNVVPLDKGTNISIPTVNSLVTVSGQMLVRYIVDHFATAAEAVRFIREHMTVYFSKALHDFGYELHFMVADKTDTFLVEFINNEAVITKMTNGSGTTLEGKEYMTNFFLSDVTFNEDGTVFTPADYGTGSAGEDNGITPLGSGLERYNYIVENIADANTKAGMRTLMNGLLYSKAYPTSECPASPVWNTEFVGSRSLTVDSPASDFNEVLTIAGNMYTNRTRNGKSGVWHTVHSAVYDINNMTLNIVVQEDGEELNFALKDGKEPSKQKYADFDNPYYRTGHSMYNVPESQFYDYLQREGKYVEDYFTNEKYRCFFRRNKDTNQTNDNISIYYPVDEGIQPGTLINYADKTYLLLNQESIENKVYHRSDGLNADIMLSTFNQETGEELNVPCFAYDLTGIATRGDEVMSAIAGNVELMTGDNELSRKLRVNQEFNAMGNWYKITSVNFKTGIARIGGDIILGASENLEYSINIAMEDAHYVGNTEQFTATAKRGEADVVNATFEWSSSDDDVIAITEDGFATFVGTGVCTITCLWKEHSLTEDIDVEVIEEPVIIDWKCSISGKASVKTNSTNTYTAVFYQADGETEDTSVTPIWSIDVPNELSQYVSMTVSGKTATVQVVKSCPVGKTFSVSVTDSENKYNDVMEVKTISWL